ncbi:hypothetical protein SK128_007089 [Halocaridina rubra]|uniref:Uncharacterized protein n=1 Tax=Halocaridina rubra TaxID=373956 RepID=A0AAN8XMX0_HALRR
MGDDEKPVDEIKTLQEISVRISPIRRLCRSSLCHQEETLKPDKNDLERGTTNKETEAAVVACPIVLRQLCFQLRTQSSRGSRNAYSIPALMARLSSRPYWHRCLCSPTILPAITEKELVPLLSLTPAHRFIVIVVTNCNDSLGSVVVGGESLMQAVYAAQNLPGLRPCIQSPSEPSLAFIKYILARPRNKKKDRKAFPCTMLNDGNVKVGMVLIYQKMQMLYAGYPLSSYGCSKQAFLDIISKYTQYNFALRMPELDQTVTSHSPEPDEEEGVIS